MPAPPSVEPDLVLAELGNSPTLVDLDELIRGGMETAASSVAPSTKKQVKTPEKQCKRLDSFFFVVY